MTDLLMEAAPVVAHVKPIVHHVAHLPQMTSISTGVSMLITAIASAVSFGLGYGVRWYFSGGSTTVSTDMTAIQNDITTIKAKVGL